jgi:DNA helicase II / ATP-dependent DNA helicase PcrA
MVPLLVKAMTESDTYRRTVTGAYDHLLVDEYQDVNPGQVGLIDHFVRAGVRLWAVGDDDQTLYAFRASDVRHILVFTKHYPGATVHSLDRNYRSSPNIVRTAKQLIRQNRRRFDKDYQPTLAEPGEMVIRGYSSPEIEARQIAGALAELLEHGNSVQDMAVLYRVGAVGLPLQTALKERAIPFAVRGGADLWQGVAAKLVIGSLYYLRDGETSQAMSRLGTNKRSQILRHELDRIRKTVRGQFAAACRSVRGIVADAVPHQSPRREKAEWHAVVDAVVALALSCSSLDQLEAKSAEQSSSIRHPPQHAVLLSTIHSAKGLEWDTVFMVGMEDGVLPHANAEDIEEERRVAYVGMTRARRRLSLTYCAERYDEKAKPSPFLFEIAGKERRSCLWTGPRLEGADHRLPLLNAAEKRRPLAPSENALQSPSPHRGRDVPMARRTGKRVKWRKPDSGPMADATD